ncbi:hypothetical protein TNCV_1382991 [Trichonephila clavipes]|nr:hypothetical protein TNCV_1382991 [Trichonephila clavipes]
MSRSSREVSYIPTVWPQERHKLRKRKAVMDEENLDENSTEIWTKSSTASTVKDIRDEYDRMANHRLPTLSMQARAFCKQDVLAKRNEDQGGYLHR